MIETAEFPFEALSILAELESWRKEVHRPIYHLHKWWAQRLGSVVRGALVAAAAPAGTDLEKLLTGPIRLDGHVVLDPFLGSGTVAGEARKLGARAVGLDINPVAVRSVRAALGPLEASALEAAFQRVEAQVAKPLRDLHRTRDESGQPVEALYWFWVKQLPCPRCGASVDLFSSRIFARHAYPRKHPWMRASCPGCGGVVALKVSDTVARCARCKLTFDPKHGPVQGGHASCPQCSFRFSLVDAVRLLGQPPPHRLYAKLVLDEEG